MTAKVSMPINSVEMQEFLFAETIDELADGKTLGSLEFKRHVRESFRYHRFATMNWLLMNGVSIPAKLLTDESHPRVGFQLPDRPAVAKEARSTKLDA